MKHQKKLLATACNALQMTSNTGVSATPKNLQLKALSASLGPYDPSHPEMERRLKAQSVYEFLDESKSTFYARMNSEEPSFDRYFPLPIPSSSMGTGPKRWKLGAVIAWLRVCEANTNRT